MKLGDHLNNTSIQTLIESLLPELSKSETKIADSILKSPDILLKSNISEFAKETNTSPATVTRFCKRIGVEGYSSLKLIVSREIGNSEVEGYSEISQNESKQAILEKLLGNVHQSLLDTTKYINTDSIQSVVDIMKMSKTIYVYGIGSSQLVAQNIVQKWSRIGKNVIFDPDAHNLITTMSGKKENACFIGISNSGESKEVINVSAIAKDLDLTTVALTQMGNNVLSEQSDYTLSYMRALENEYRNAATASLHVQFFVVDILFHTYVSQNYEDVTDKVNSSRKAIEMYKNLQN